MYASWRRQCGGDWQSSFPAAATAAALALLLFPRWLAPVERVLKRFMHALRPGLPRRWAAGGERLPTPARADEARGYARRRMHDASGRQETQVAGLSREHVRKLVYLATQRQGNKSHEEARATAEQAAAGAEASLGSGISAVAGERAGDLVRFPSAAMRKLMDTWRAELVGDRCHRCDDVDAASGEVVTDFLKIQSSRDLRF